MLLRFTGTISLGMGTFDLLAWGAGVFAPDDAFTAFYQQLHSNDFYNAFQFGASALTIFSLGGIKGFYDLIKAGKFREAVQMDVNELERNGQI